VNSWIPFSSLMPTDAYGDRHHPSILVTNNISARTAQDHTSHIWLVSNVYKHVIDEMPRPGYIYAYAGEVTAFSVDTRVRNLSHWRPALPEEWSEESHLRISQALGQRVIRFDPDQGRGFTIPGQDGASGLSVGINADGTLLLLPEDERIGGFSLTRTAAVTLALLLHRELAVDSFALAALPEEGTL
jgi:hypothetical protein